MSSAVTVPFVIGWAIAAAVWQSVSKPAAQCVCSGVEVNQDLLGLLGRHLDRCGPEQLGAACPTGLVTRTSIVLALVVGVLVGFSSARCFAAYGGRWASSLARRVGVTPSTRRALTAAA